jgi:hypothetical protein
MISILPIGVPGQPIKYCAMYVESPSLSRMSLIIPHTRRSNRQYALARIVAVLTVLLFSVVVG